MATINGQSSQEFFRDAAQRQQRSNAFATYDAGTGRATPRRQEPTPSEKLLATMPKRQEKKAEVPKPATAPQTVKETAQKPSEPAGSVKVAKPAPKAPGKAVKPWEKVLQDAIRSTDQNVRNTEALTAKAKQENERFRKSEQDRSQQRTQARQEAREARSPIIRGVESVGRGIKNVAESNAEAVQRTGRGITSGLKASLETTASVPEQIGRASKSALMTTLEAIRGDTEKRQRASKRAASL